MESASLASFAVQRHPAAVQRNQMPGNRQSQADTAGNMAVGLDRDKRFENDLLLFDRDAPAGVTDPKMKIRGSNFSTEFNPSTFSELARIAQQIEQDLSQPYRIGAQERQPAGNIELPFDLRARMMTSNSLESLKQERARIN